jgi:hypothetical protein
MWATSSRDDVESLRYLQVRNSYSGLYSTLLILQSACQAGLGIHKGQYGIPTV